MVVDVLVQSLECDERGLVRAVVIQSRAPGIDGPGGLLELAFAEVAIRLEETAVPVQEQVRGCCELLGLDPLYVANEGRFAAFVPERDVAKALEVLAATSPDGSAPACIGRVEDAPAGQVVLDAVSGGQRVLAMLSGEQLPRIC